MQRNSEAVIVWPWVGFLLGLWFDSCQRVFKRNKGCMTRHRGIMSWTSGFMFRNSGPIIRKSANGPKIWSRKLYHFYHLNQGVLRFFRISNSFRIYWWTCACKCKLNSAWWQFLQMYISAADISNWYWGAGKLKIDEGNEVQMKMDHCLKE